jgi:hypothetical protein
MRRARLILYGLLVALGTRVDRIEQLASRIDFQTRKQDGKRRSEL